MANGDPAAWLIRRLVSYQLFPDTDGEYMGISFEVTEGEEFRIALPRAAILPFCEHLLSRTQSMLEGKSATANDPD